MTAKKLIYYILSGFVLGTLLLVFIQFNTSKNISNLITGNEKLLNEFNVSNQLKDLEKDVIAVESKIRGTVNTNDTLDIDGLEKEIQQIEADLRQLQKISDDDNSVKYIDELDYWVHEKLKFSHNVLDSLHDVGKIAAENIITSQKSIMLTDSIFGTIHKIDSTRKNLLRNITTTIDKSGSKALEFSTILITLVLISAAALFWYIINTMNRQILLIDELNISEKAVKKAAAVKENFLANMSHEIRTPLNAILGFTKLLGRKNLDAESNEHIRTIQKSGENLLLIINSILDLSKIEAGMMRIESAPFNIRELVFSTEAMFNLIANEKQINLSSNIDKSVPIILEGDANRLSQILVNLIGNALKFTQKGYIVINIGTKEKRSDSINLSIVITDSGIGIKKEKINAVFERFVQADDAVTRKFGGTGLGLSIVKELVLLQHGTIYVESEYNVGTSIHITIPFKIISEKIKTNYSEYNYPNTGFISKAFKILVVEDNLINQSLIKYLFSEWQLEYELAKNGKEAVDLLAGNPNKYNLVLMDIQMPVMDGYTAIDEIRNQLKLNVPVIAMTAHALAGEKEKCIAFGMNEYISKPIQEDLLYNLITKFIDLKKPVENNKKNISKTLKNSYQFINLSYLREICGGNIEYEKGLTQQFLESIPKDLIALENSFKINDIETLRHLAHNIKTTISVMGLNEKLDMDLDMLAYENLPAKNINKHISIINLICNEALLEAKEFFTTF